MRLTSLIAFLVGILPASGFTQAALGPGSPAPEVKVEAWVKGPAYSNIGARKIAVIEFWATWCGPCKATIPHLTKLAAKYKDVDFVGVSSYERGDDYVQKVDAFVVEMGDKMVYSVGRDDAEFTMAKAWMAPAGQKSIPTAFIVDKTGAIAWIGHPNALEPVLKKVMAGTFDIKAERARFDKQIALEAAREKAAEEVALAQEAYADGEKVKALAALDALVKHEDASVASQAIRAKLMILMKDNPGGAVEFARDACKSHNGAHRNLVLYSAWSHSRNSEANFAMLKQIAENALASGKDAPYDCFYAAETFAAAKDYRTAIKYLDRAIKALDSDAEMSKLEGMAEWRKSLIDKSREWQRLAGVG